MFSETIKSEDSSSSSRDAFEISCSGQEHQYGSINGVETGDTWIRRADLYRTHVHKSKCNIDCGPEGPYSIVLSKRENLNDQGYSFVIATGEIESVPVDVDCPSNKLNSCLFKAITSQFPFRVLRSHLLHNQYSPTHGFRYDGLYRSVQCVREEVEMGQVLKFVMVRVDSPMQPAAVWLYSTDDYCPVRVMLDCDLPPPTPLVSYETGVKHFDDNEEDVQVYHENPFREVKYTDMIGFEVTPCTPGTELVEDWEEEDTEDKVKTECESVWDEMEWEDDELSSPVPVTCFTADEAPVVPIIVSTEGREQSPDSQSSREDPLRIKSGTDSDDAKIDPESDCSESRPAIRFGCSCKPPSVILLNLLGRQVQNYIDFHFDHFCRCNDPDKPEEVFEKLLMKNIRTLIQQSMAETNRLILFLLAQNFRNKEGVLIDESLVKVPLATKKPGRRAGQNVLRKSNGSLKKRRRSRKSDPVSETVQEPIALPAVVDDIENWPDIPMEPSEEDFEAACEGLIRDCAPSPSPPPDNSYRRSARITSNLDIDPTLKFHGFHRSDTLSSSRRLQYFDLLSPYQEDLPHFSNKDLYLAKSNASNFTQMFKKFYSKGRFKR